MELYRDGVSVFGRPPDLLEVHGMFEKISDYLSKQLDIAKETITEDTTFESLGIDSLDIVEMVVDLEDELGIELELNDKITTIGELAEFVESKL